MDVLLWNDVSLIIYYHQPRELMLLKANNNIKVTYCKGGIFAFHTSFPRSCTLKKVQSDKVNSKFDNRVTWENIKTFFISKESL